MSNNIVSLFLDDSSIRLLVSSGRNIKKWGELSLEPGLVKGGVVVKEEEIAAKIQHFFQAHKVRDKDIIVGLSGLHCITRPITFPELPKTMIADAVIREAKQVLPIPLEQLYLSWQHIASPEGRTRVFLVAIQRNPADSLLKTLQMADLRPYLMDLKPLSLARVAKQSEAVIVDVQTTEFDIVIMNDGIPQPIRTVSFPSGLSREKKIPVVKQELDRTIEFYNSNNKEKPLSSDSKILVAGELADENVIPDLLSEKFRYPILPLQSPFKSPEGFSPTRYLINMGLAMKESYKEASSMQVNLNVLPISPPRQPISKAKLAAVIGSIAVIGLVAPLYILIQNTSADTDSVRNQLTSTNQLFRESQLQKQKILSGIADLEQQIVEAEAIHGALTEVFSSLEVEGIGVNQNLLTVVDNLPEAIVPARISYTGDRLTISGQAVNEEVISSYALRLDASEKFAEVVVSKLRRIVDAKMDFTLTLINHS